MTLKRIHRVASALAIGLIAACAAVAEPRPAFEANIPRDRGLERLGQAFIAADRADGLSIAIIDQGDVRFFNFGSVSRATARRPTEASVYEIGSISKVFTSLLLAHAVTEGRVDLQDDIRQYLPGDIPNLAFEGDPVRLIHLAEMTSGLPDNIPDLAPFLEEGGMDGAPALVSKRWQAYSNAELLVALETATLVDRPGAITRHSNVAATVLGIILETVYGQPYEELVARYIETPYGMEAGTGNDRAAELASGYNGNHAAMPALGGRYILSAGGLRYSSADMARFVGAQLAAAGDAIRLSQEPTWGPQDNAAGFNWWISTSAQGGRVLRTSGSTFGSSSYVEVRPDLDYGIVLLTNRSGAEGALHEFAARAFQEIEAAKRGTGLPPAPVGGDGVRGKEASR